MVLNGVCDLSQIEKLKAFADKGEFKRAVADIKYDNKVKLTICEENIDIDLDPHALFDVQVKRIHEYKRQMLNVLHIIARYNEMLAHPEKIGSHVCSFQRVKQLQLTMQQNKPFV